MNLYLLAAGGGDEFGLMNPNLKAGAWALGIFIVVLLVLRKMAWGPIIEGLQTREKRIAESLEKAEAIEKATRELTQTNEGLLAEAQAKAQQIVVDARAAAVAAGAELQAKAEADIDAQRERFQRETRLEVEKARAEMREAAVDLTIQATAKIIGRALTGDDQRRLVQEALTDAEAVARN